MIDYDPRMDYTYQDPVPAPPRRRLPWRRALLVLGFVAAFTLGLTVDARAATYGPRDLFIPADLPLPWVDGYGVCESVYTAERLRPTPSGKTHIDVCRLKPRTLRFELANGNVVSWNEVLYPDEVNIGLARLRFKLNHGEHTMSVMRPGGGSMDIDPFNVVRVNVVRTPNAEMELAAAPYFIGPAFFDPFVRIVS